MALSLECAADSVLRHVVARSRGRRLLYADAAARAAMIRRLGLLCTRHRLHCIVYSVIDRCLHVVMRGSGPASALASEELAGSGVRLGHCLSTVVNEDLYLLEVARHALLAPVRAGFVRRAVDWPHSSARESLGLRPAPDWLDAAPLLRLLGPLDDNSVARLRRLIACG